MRNCDFRKINTWDKNSKLCFWRKYSDCDKLKGTDGTTFALIITKGSIPRAYNPHICRCLYLEYSKDVEHMGIQGFRFTAFKANFNAHRVSKVTGRYCLEDEVENLHNAGVQPLKSCTKGKIDKYKSSYCLFT